MIFAPATALIATWLQEYDIPQKIFRLLPWVFIIYVHVIPKWLIHGAGGRSHNKKAQMSHQQQQRTSSTTTRASFTAAARARRQSLNVDHLQCPGKFATELRGYLQALAERVGFRHPLYFVLYHLKFSLFAAMYARYQTTKKHPDIFDRFRRRFGKKLDPKDLEHVMPYLDLADLCYNVNPEDIETDLNAQGYMLLRHRYNVEPGKPAHFMAVNHKTKEIIWCIRGTFAMTDVITDIDFEPTYHAVESPLLQNAENPRHRKSVLFHEGVLASAHNLANEGRSLLENVFLPQGYKLRIVGHSLGAGVACCLGILLFSKIKAFQEDHSRIHVYSFAPVPCVGYSASLAHSPIITSVVNNADLVVRFSALNLVHFHRLLIRLEERFSDWTLFTVLFWWTKSNKAKLAKATGDYDLIDDLSKEFNEVDPDYGLYVPGKILYVWRLGDADGGSGCKIAGLQTDASHPSFRSISLEASFALDHAVCTHRTNMQEYIEEQQQEQQEQVSLLTTTTATT